MMQKMVTQAENGVEIYQLINDPRPTDDIYGEQPYASPCGTRLAVHHYPTERFDGGVTVLDLGDGSRHSICRDNDVRGDLAFNSWGRHLFYQQTIHDATVLIRCDLMTLRQDVVLELPEVDGCYSQGTVSDDQRHFAVVIRREQGPGGAMLFDLGSGRGDVLLESATQTFSHEQFSRDGQDRLLVQANSFGPTIINLGVADIRTRQVTWLPVDANPGVPLGRWVGAQRHTPRCTGHEAWMGASNRVFFSTAYDREAGTSIWTAAAGDERPEPIEGGDHEFCHVSVSRCGRFWIGDAPKEARQPVYIGSFATGRYRHLVDTNTVWGDQWSHPHPYLTADNRWVVFNSTRMGHPQVFAATIPPEFLVELDAPV